MLKNQIITELNKLFADNEVQIILCAILQNSIICDELNQDGLNKIVSALPKPLSVYMLNPAIIAIANQDLDINICHDLKTKSLKLINPDLWDESKNTLERVLIQKNYSPSLKDALHVAFMLNDKLNEETNISEFSKNANYTNIFLENSIEFWSCVFACILQFQNEPEKIINKIILETKSQRCLEIISNAILSNPMQTQDAIELFINVFSKQKIENIIVLLNHLNKIGRRDICKEIAIEIAKLHPELCISICDLREKINNLNWINVQEIIFKIQHIALLKYYAGINKDASELLEVENEILNVQNKRLEKIKKDINNPDFDGLDFDEIDMTKVLSNQNDKITLREIRESMNRGSVNESAKQIAVLMKTKKVNPLVYKTAAEISFRLGDYHNALNEITIAISMGLDDFETKILAGRIHHSLNEFDKGFVLIKNDIEFFESLSDEDLFLFLDLAIHAQKYETVIGICEERIKKQDNSLLFSFMAEAQIKNKQNAKAMGSLKKALEINRGNPKAWLLLSGLEEHAGDLPKAMDALFTGVKYCPNSQKLFIELINKLIEQDCNSRAEKYLFEANNLIPENISDVIELVELFKKYKNFDNAFKFINLAMIRWPRNIQLKISYAELLLICSRYEESRTLLQELMKTDKLDEVGLQTHFYSLVGSNKAKFPLVRKKSDIDIPMIKTVIEKLTKLSPESKWIGMFNAEVALLDNNIDESIKIYTCLLKDLENTPKEIRWKIQAGMAQVQIAKGEFESAIVLLNEIKAFFVDSPEVLFLLVDAYEQNGMLTNAYETAIEVVEYYPMTQKTLEWFKSTLSRLNKLDNAIDQINNLRLLNDEKELLNLFLSLNKENINVTRELINDYLVKHTLKTNQAIIIANLLAEINELDKAIEILSIIKDDNNENYSIQFLLTCLLRKSGRLAETYSALENSSHSIVEFSRPYLSLELAVLMHDQVKIETSLNEIEKNPSFTSIHFDDFINSLELNSNLLPDSWREIICKPETAYILVAEEYFKSGNLPRTLELLEKSRNINPESIKTNWFLCEISKSFLLEIDEKKSATNIDKLLENPVKENKYIVHLSCLKAEIAFSRNEDILAASIVSKILIGNEDNNRLKCLQARLLYREGDLINSRQLLQEVETSISARSSENIDLPDQISSNCWLVEAAIDLENWNLAQKWISIALKRVNPSPLIILMAIKLICRLEIINDICKETGAIKHLIDVETLKQLLSSIINSHDKHFSVKYPIIYQWNRLFTALDCFSFDDFEIGIENENAEVFAFIFRKRNNDVKFNQVAQQYKENINILLQSCLHNRKNNLLESIKCSECAISVNPNNPLSHALKAILLEEFGKTEEALKSIKDALSIWPDESEWQIMAAKINGEIGDSKNEIIHLESAFQLNPQNQEIRKNLIHKYLESGDFEKSVKLIKNLDDIASKSFDELIILAEISFRNHSFDKSHEIAMRAIRKEPTSIQPYLLLARIAIELNNHKNAQELIQKVLVYSPNNPDAHLLMARIIEEHGGIEKSLNYLENISQRIQDDQSIIIKKSEYIKSIRGKSESRKYLLQFESEEIPRILTNLALIEIEMGLYDEAERHAQNSLNEYSNQPLLISSLGKMYREQGNLDKSVKYYLDALVLEPDKIESYIKLSEMYLLRREPDNVIRIIEQGIEKFPSEAKLYSLAGKTYWDAKDFTKAEEMFRRAAIINPDDFDVRRQLGAVMSINLIHQKQEAN